MAGSQQKKSRLAHALQRALDETHVFDSRRDWAFVLSVTPGAISQWLSDRTIPRATTLRALLEILRSKVPDDHMEPVRELEALLSIPATEASPAHADTIGPTLQDYVIAPAFHGLLARFRATLRTLKPSMQEDLIRCTAAALPGLIDPERAKYLDLVERYRPGTQINETDLPDILSTRLWKRVFIISKNPYELLTNPRDSHDENRDLILNIYQTSLKYLVNKCGASVSYIVVRRDETVQKLNMIVEEVFVSDLNPGAAQRLIDARLVDAVNFERARACAARRFRDGGEVKPAAIIVFNPGSEHVFGYSWFEDTAGCILDTHTIHLVLRSLDEQHIKQNIIRLQSHRPILKSAARSTGRATSRGTH